MQLDRGSVLGPYEILAALGAGGMGEVYRARDARLGRHVALKILPAELAAEPRLRQRFEREAKLISSLNHPNICALYDVGEAVLNGVLVQYFVMEELEGETLDKRLRRGPLPMDEALQYAIQIADALDKAHRKQILHRDLKPANVMITRVGAKLLDFGLAKLVTRPGPGGEGEGAGSRSSTRSSEEETPARPITEEGATPGTFGYLSPEQLLGQELDSRTDVFALGVTLYEMVAGRHPFFGEGRVAVTESILGKEPLPLSHHRPEVPEDLDWLVRMCLRRDRDERMQSAHDVMLELRRIAAAGSGQGREASGLGRRVTVAGGLLVAAAVLLTLAAVAALVVGRSRNVSDRIDVVRRFAISLPAGAALIPDPAHQRFAVSPDGGRIAYVAATQPQQLYIFGLDTQEALPLPGTEGAMAPFFAPDGQSVAFFTTDGKLKKVWLSTGGLITLSSGRSSRGATWGPGDRLLFGEPWTPLQSISAAGGPVESVASDVAQANARWPMFLPDGKHILYTDSEVAGDYENARLHVLSLESGKDRVVLEGATYGRYVPTGHLMFFRSGTVFKVRFDPRTLRVSGQPVPLVSDVEGYYGNGLAHYAVAYDGALFYVPTRAEDSRSELVWVDRQGRVSPVTALRQPYDEPRLSPDGNRLVVTVGHGPTSDLWLCDLDRDAWVRLTSEGRNTTGLWSPDGRQLAFASNRTGGFKLFLVPYDRTTPPRQLTTRTSWAFPLSWSPDGRHLAIQELFRTRDSDVHLLRIEDGDLSPILSRAANETGAAISPDGQWMAYQSDESGRDEIYLQRYPPDGPRRLVSSSGGTLPVWRSDGRELFYRNGGSMMAVEIGSGEGLPAGKPHRLFEGDFAAAYDVAPHGSRFIMVRRPKNAAHTQIHVVTGLLHPAR
ncbi:MAG TPA: protein kinase [Thermoanaerobaculia bacterium]|nr:protein kinase [Thermoanaerobaculia bacterium]